MSKGIVYIAIILLAAVIPVPRFAHADDIILKESGRVIVGKVLEDKNGMLTIKLSKGGSCVVPRDWVNKIVKKDISEEDLYSKGDIYLQKAKQIDPRLAEDNLALADWCLKNGTTENGLLHAAESHFNIAMQLDPSAAKRAPEDLLKAREKTAEKSYSIAELEFENGNYVKSEQEALSIISVFSETKYASKARDLIIKIWGKERAFAVIEPKEDLLPVVVYTKEDLQATLFNMQNDEQKELYLLKCIGKAKDYVQRSQEVSASRKANYYRIAIDCYRNALSSVKPEVRAVADSNIQDLLKKYFADLSAPYNDYSFSLISNLMLMINDEKLIQDISAQYSKIGDGLLKKARRLKQPDKGKEAAAAYFSYSIANNFSKDGKIREKAIENMVECQRMERARK
ncbi:MAG: hypothetical protein PHE80_01190 [Candidatus Omnitrophica bacterium]|nr:hypothetical protein [Candidatus Omnitrophota bacterium]MDD5737369.1 hypothetical protein [Candidatus Omnitrophota bacterium]